MFSYPNDFHACIWAFEFRIINDSRFQALKSKKESKMNELYAWQLAFGTQAKLIRGTKDEASICQYGYGQKDDEQNCRKAKRKTKKNLK